MDRVNTNEAELPLQQLIVLAVCRFGEPIALSSINPYLPDMIESFNVSTNSVAKWAGIANASFSASQGLTGMIWGQMSDRFGRKYLLIASLSIAMTTSLLLGLCRSLPFLLTVRALSGAGSASGSIINAIVSEMVPRKKLRPLAFCIMPLVWMTGSVLGSLLGGLLAEPAKKYPHIFRHSSSVFGQFPFILPPLVIVTIFLLGLITGILYLQETLESKKNRKDYGLMLGKLFLSKYHRRGPRKETRNLEESLKPLLVLRSVSRDDLDDTWESKENFERKYRQVFSSQSSLNLLVCTLLAFHSQAYDQVLPMFMHHPVQDIHTSNSKLLYNISGGLGMSSSQIGIIYTAYSISCIFIQSFVFPVVAGKCGVLTCLKLVTTIFPIVYALTPVVLLAPNSFGKQVALFFSMLLNGFLTTFAFPCSTILLTHSASSPSVLGTLTGISTSTSAIARATGAFLGGSLFSYGVNRGYSVIPFWVLAAITLPTTFPVFCLKETKD
ncbi:major facilitator superfamily domain-containing protein [Xylogone sp. PMI_703]|nr:major facilitator superfamily domain-containing protein [Xylogone sp. PMI_703]